MQPSEIKEAIITIAPVKLVPDQHDHGKTGIIVACHTPFYSLAGDRILHASVRWEDGEVSQHCRTRLMRIKSGSR